MGADLDFGRMCCFFYYIKTGGQDCDIIYVGGRSKKT